MKIAKLARSGLNYERFEKLIQIASSVTQIIYEWRIIPYNKIVPKKNESRDQVGGINFVGLNISQFDIVQNLKAFNTFPKTIRYELRDSGNIQGCVLNTRTLVFFSFYFITFNFFMLLLLNRPYKAVGTFRALPWYDQFCFFIGWIFKTILFFGLHIVKKKRKKIWNEFWKQEIFVLTCLILAKIDKLTSTCQIWTGKNFFV